MISVDSPRMYGQKCHTKANVSQKSHTSFHEGSVGNRMDITIPIAIAKYTIGKRALFET